MHPLLALDSIDPSLAHVVLGMVATGLAAIAEMTRRLWAKVADCETSHAKCQEESTGLQVKLARLEEQNKAQAIQIADNKTHAERLQRKQDLLEGTVTTLSAVRQPRATDLAPKDKETGG